MRIKTLIITTITATTLMVSALIVSGLIASVKLDHLSEVEARAQEATRGISTLLVLTHEYALHAEPRAAYQWHKHMDSLLQTIGSGNSQNEALAPESHERIKSLVLLFTQLEDSNADITAANRQQRTEILLDQLLSNTQSISDRFYELSLETAKQRDETGKLFRFAGYAIPLFTLFALGVISLLLITRILRPLEKMRLAVDAVAQGNLGVRSATGTQDEFGQLSHAFDTMALDLVTQLRQEIIERGKIEQNLQLLVDERTASLKAIVDTAADGIITIDDNGLILTVNRAAEQLFGYRADELIGHNVGMLMPAPYQNTHDGYIKKYRTTGISKIIGTGRELEAKHRDGHHFPMFISLSEVVLPNEHRYTGIVRDISEQKKTEHDLRTARDEAERANLAKSEFLSSMSHELRTPMNAILGFGQLMSYDENLTAQQKDNVREILNAGQHLLELINEVLDLAKIESGHMELLLEPVELCVVVEDCLRLVSGLADKRGIRISHSGLKGAMVMADATRLKQALLNLLSNAVKYNKDNGSVHLEVKRLSANRGQIRVTDSGPGIAAERLPELFQPFNRLDADRGNIEGTGIGLTITRRIIEMMGGSVKVESIVGSGSTFWIELPFDYTTESAQKNALAEDAGKDTQHGAAYIGPQQTILYIEDNPANMRLISQIVSLRKNTRLLTTHTPEWGIELAHSYRPDLILLDINMPGMDGYQVLDVLRADNKLCHIPVVAVTAEAMPRDIERGIAAGFSEYLTKPLDILHFQATLERLLDTETVNRE